MTDHQWIESSQTKVLSVLNDTRATTNNLINSLGTTKVRKTFFKLQKKN